MSENILIREAKRRGKIFKNLSSNLEQLKAFLKEFDKDCRVFLFGSVAKNDYVLASDIDILIETQLKPNEVIKILRDTGFDEPFEFHVVNRKEFEVYKCFVRELKEI
ncbi:MAG: nucleotidyltransferase domain-containing protein [Nitrososphaeria archaeon]